MWNLGKEGFGILSAAAMVYVILGASPAFGKPVFFDAFNVTCDPALLPQAQGGCQFCHVAAPGAETIANATKSPAVALKNAGQQRGLPPNDWVQVICVACQDVDGDGFRNYQSGANLSHPVCGQDDCNDSPGAGNINPGAPDLCNGSNSEDCDPGSPDGSDETLFGNACDSSADSDLCADGFQACSGNSLACNDTGPDILDLCDGSNIEDCNPATPDGSGEPFLGDPCDGVDSDFCDEGVVSCPAGVASLVCTDDTGDDIEDRDLKGTCSDGQDNDCDSLFDGDDPSCFALGGERRLQLAPADFVPLTPQGVNFAMDFDGIDDGITIPHQDALRLETFTLEARVRFEPSTIGGTILLRQDGPDFLGFLGLFLFESLDGNNQLTQSIHFNHDQNIFDLFEQDLFPVGEWFHIAVVNAPPVGRLLVNGQLLQSNFNFSPQVSSSENLIIGANEFSPGAFANSFSGQIDEVRIWSVARSDAQVRAFRDRLVDPNSPGLVGYWRFDELPDEQVVRDLSPTGADGSLGLGASVEGNDPVRVGTSGEICGYNTNDSECPLQIVGDGEFVAPLLLQPGSIVRGMSIDTLDNVGAVARARLFRNDTTFADPELVGEVKSLKDTPDAETYVSEFDVVIDPDHFYYVSFDSPFSDPVGDFGVCGFGAGDCFEQHGSLGCNDVTCCNVICELDPFCCDTQWDGICVNEAVEFCAACSEPASALRVTLGFDPPPGPGPDRVAAIPGFVFDPKVTNSDRKKTTNSGAITPSLMKDDGSGSFVGRIDLPDGAQIDEMLLTTRDPFSAGVSARLRRIASDSLTGSTIASIDVDGTPFIRVTLTTSDIAEPVVDNAGFYYYIEIEAGATAEVNGVQIVYSPVDPTGEPGHAGTPAIVSLSLAPQRPRQPFEDSLPSMGTTYTSIDLPDGVLITKLTLHALRPPGSGPITAGLFQTNGGTDFAIECPLDQAEIGLVTLDTTDDFVQEVSTTNFPAVIVDRQSSSYQVAFFTPEPGGTDTRTVGFQVEYSADDDGDSLFSIDDNCPLEPNLDQADFDSDGEGDACDPDDDNDGVDDSEDTDDGNPNVCRDADGDACDDCSSGTDNPLDDGADGDVDGICDTGDNCPGDSNADQDDFDDDGSGDVCETGAKLSDVNLSDRVDGFDLAIFGLALGSDVNVPDSGYNANADLDRNGGVDGMDLYLLTKFFGQDVP